MDNRDSNQGFFCPNSWQDGTNIPHSSNTLNYSFSSIPKFNELWNLFLFYKQNNINHTQYSPATEPNNLWCTQAQPSAYMQQTCETGWGNFIPASNSHSNENFAYNHLGEAQAIQEQRIHYDFSSENSSENEQSSHPNPESDDSMDENFSHRNSKTPKISKRNVCKKKETKQPFDWNEKYDKLLVESVGKYKKDWQKVEGYFKRNVAKLTIHTLKNRFRHLSGVPYQLRIKFSHEEDLQIAYYFSQFGTDWDKVAEFFPQRTKQMVKNRYYSFIRKKGNYERLLEEVKQSTFLNSFNVTMDNQNHDSTSIFLGESPSSDSKIKVFAESNPNFEFWNHNTDGQLSHKIAPFDA